MDAFYTFIHVMNRGIAGTCHLIAMLIIIIGIIKAVLIYIKDIFSAHKSRDAIQESRLEIGHSFSLALALLIGASIINTTLAPTWTEIGQLASIIAIRTTLNFFLIKELKV